MTDRDLDIIARRLPDMPRLVVGHRKYVHFPGVVIVLDRVGKGERWALSPSRSVVRLEGGMVPQAKAHLFPLEALRWVFRAERMDFVGYGHAMAARTL